MIEWIIKLLIQNDINIGFFRLVNYVTFRSIFGILTSMLFSVILGHRIIVFLYRNKFRDSSGDFSSTEYSAYSKRGTPTAGGIIIIISTLISTFLWCDLSNRIIQVMIIGFTYLGFVGFIDDFQKCKFKTSLSGLSQFSKTALLLIFIIPFALFFISHYNPLPVPLKTKIFLPYIKNPVFDAGNILYFFFTVFTLFAIINSINITDGLDGLLGGLSILTIGVYIVFAYIIGNSILSKHYLFPYMPSVSELAVFCSILIGGIVGFLWYNFYPAEIFMGDTGSLAIGGTIAMTVFFTKQEFLFLITGGFFVFEIFSSLMQDKVANWSRLGRRIFYRAPYHHTLIHKGIPEPKAVLRIFFIGVLLALLALASIKIR